MCLDDSFEEDPHEDPRVRISWLLQATTRYVQFLRGTLSGCDQVIIHRYCWRCHGFRSKDSKSGLCQKCWTTRRRWLGDAPNTP